MDIRHVFFESTSRVDQFSTVTTVMLKGWDIIGEKIQPMDSGERGSDSFSHSRYSTRVYRHVPPQDNKGNGCYRCQDRRIPRL